jgi:hypothetical protein
VPVASILNTLGFAHDSIVTPGHDVGYPRSDGDMTPGAGIRFLRVALADGLNRVGLAPLRLGSAITGTQTVKVEGLALVSASITPGHDLVPTPPFRVPPRLAGGPVAGRNISDSPADLSRGVGSPIISG